MAEATQSSVIVYMDSIGYLNSGDSQSFIVYSNVIVSP